MCTGNIASYNTLLLLTDPICKNFHERLCAKISDEGGDYRVIILIKHAWDACREWFPKENILVNVILCMVVELRITITSQVNVTLFTGGMVQAWVAQKLVNVSFYKFLRCTIFTIWRPILVK
jgi:hypothetical protein